MADAPTVPMHRPSRARGVALVTALLVVAVVTTLAATLALGQQVWLRQAQNQRDRAQAAAVEAAAIAWAGIVLERDAAKQDGIDHLGEDWARSLPALPAEGGAVAGVVGDAQARFNLNNLWRGSAPSQPDLTLFRRLLSRLQADPALSEALLDWLDPDAVARPGGAEDFDYALAPTPYRAANRAMASVDELRLVRGFDAATVERLRPYVAALPAYTAINLNTAPPLVLSALFDLAPADAERLAEARKGNAFRRLGDVQVHLPPGASAPPGTWDFKSAYFELDLTTRFGRLERRTVALISRADGKAALLWQARRL